MQPTFYTFRLVRDEAAPKRAVENRIQGTTRLPRSISTPLTESVGNGSVQERRHKIRPDRVGSSPSKLGTGPLETPSTIRRRSQ